MKKTTLLISLLTASACAFGQLGGLKNKVNSKLNQKIDRQIDRKVDEAFDGKPKKSKENNPSENAEKTESREVSSSETSEGTAAPKAPAFATFSKFDFMPGEKVLAFDDFSTDNIGDFPAKWNTDGSGEVVTSNTLPGKWLAMGQYGKYRPEYINYTLPDNYTVEFDAAFNEDGNGGSFYVYLGHAKEGNVLSPDNSGIQLQFVSSGSNYVTISNWCYVDECKGTTDVSNTNNYQFNDKGEKIRVSLWRQKQRLRVYINETKVFDLPRVMDATIPNNILSFRSYTRDNNKFAFITNLRVAAGAPDTRNKLITEGKFVTSGILFDSGSDKIRPESYGVLKDIATVLKENAGVKVKIVGHTDSDGDDKKNLELSAQRAASVKTTLSKEFGIDESRMQTEGKGEAQPVTPNTSSEGKANNRRVEFIKI